MRIIVQKFGGTSLSTKQARNQAIQHIKRAHQEYDAVVVVVSAMGRNGDPYATDSLLQFIHENGDSLPSRERDLLLSCGEIISAAVLCSILRSEGIPSTVLTGGQAGIRTDARFGDARIMKVIPARVTASLKCGEVVIVTGFQGSTADGEITTLGRGGSDTTAAALGAALQASVVEIYTDVDGILTADPRIIEDARPLPAISYHEVCQMANYGAKVIHPRAVEIAMHARIPLRIRSTFSFSEGTWVMDPALLPQYERVSDRHVTAIAHTQGLTQVQVIGRRPSTRSASAGLSGDGEGGDQRGFHQCEPLRRRLHGARHEALRAKTILEEFGYAPKLNPGCAKVAVIGGGINGVPGIMSKIVSALAAHHISILQSADSNTTIWVLLHQDEMELALRALHDQFALAER